MTTTIQPGQAFRVRGETQVRQCARCEPRVCFGRVVSVVEDLNGGRFYADTCEPAADLGAPPFAEGDLIRSARFEKTGVVWRCFISEGRWFVDASFAGGSFTALADECNRVTTPPAETNDPPFIGGDRIQQSPGGAIGVVVGNPLFRFGRWCMSVNVEGRDRPEIWAADGVELAPVVDEPRPFDSRGRLVGFSRTRRPV